MPSTFINLHKSRRDVHILPFIHNPKCPLSLVSEPCIAFLSAVKQFGNLPFNDKLLHQVTAVSLMNMFNKVCKTEEELYSPFNDILMQYMSAIMTCHEINMRSWINSNSVHSGKKASSDTCLFVDDKVAAIFEMKLLSTKAHPVLEAFGYFEMMLHKEHYTTSKPKLCVLLVTVWNDIMTIYGCHRFKQHTTIEQLGYASIRYSTMEDDIDALASVLYGLYKFSITETNSSLSSTYEDTLTTLLTKSDFTSKVTKQHKLVYKLDNGLIVKFVQHRYGNDVHSALAGAGLAPILHNVIDLQSTMGWKAVIMDTVETSVTSCYSESELQRLKKYLSKNKFVHGDLRCPNVLIDDSTKNIKVVDFDWAGKVGEARYPLNTNPLIHWPRENIAGTLIRMDDDSIMLSRCQNENAWQPQSEMMEENGEE